MKIIFIGINFYILTQHKPFITVSSEIFEGHADPRTRKDIEIAGPASQLHVLTLETNIILKLLPVQQDLQMLYLPVHPFYCQSGAEDLQISWRLHNIIIGRISVCHGISIRIIIFREIA